MRIKETKSTLKNFKAIVEAPGLKKENLEANLVKETNTLVLSDKNKENSEFDVVIGDRYEASSIKITVEDGIITVTAEVSSDRVVPVNID